MKKSVGTMLLCRCDVAVSLGQLDQLHSTVLCTVCITALAYMHALVQLSTRRSQQLQQLVVAQHGVTECACCARCLVCGQAAQNLRGGSVHQQWAVAPKGRWAASHTRAWHVQA
jgi:hypothetical protein